MPEYQRDGTRVPKVYTSPRAMLEALEGAKLTYNGHIGGLLVLRTDDGLGGFLVPNKTTLTATVCFVRAFEAGIRYAKDRATEDFEAAGMLPDEAPALRNRHLYEIRVRDSFYYVIASRTDIALDKFAHLCGYDTYADIIADPEMPEDAAELPKIRVITYGDAVQHIVLQAYDSNVFSDERHVGLFTSNAEWAIWHMEGETGKRCKAFADLYGLDYGRVWDAVNAGLRRRPLFMVNTMMARQELARPAV